MCCGKGRLRRLVMWIVNSFNCPKPRSRRCCEGLGLSTVMFVPFTVPLVLHSEPAEQLTVLTLLTVTLVSLIVPLVLHLEPAVPSEECHGGSWLGNQLRYQVEIQLGLYFPWIVGWGWSIVG